MHKGIRLAVTLWIEGEDEPAHNFEKFTSSAVAELLAAGAWRHPGLKVVVKKTEEDRSEDEEDLK